LGDRKLYLGRHIYHSVVEGRTVDSEILPLVTFSLVVVVIALAVLLFMERERKKPTTEESPSRDRTESRFGSPFSVSRTVTTGMSDGAKDRLRILNLEREIQGYALRRLYEATAEGKISADERDSLSQKYKQDLARIKEEIARGESVVALNELERMQQDFLNLFSDRFEELNKRIEELRTISGFAPAEPFGVAGRPEPLVPEEPEERLEEGPLEEEEEEEEEGEEAPEIPAEKQAPSRKKKVSRPKPPAEPEKSEAEKKVEQIVAEVERVLERLGQMEVEE